MGNSWSLVLVLMVLLRDIFSLSLDSGDSSASPSFALTDLLIGKIMDVATL